MGSNVYLLKSAASQEFILVQFLTLSSLYRRKCAIQLSLCNATTHDEDVDVHTSRLRPPSAHGGIFVPTTTVFYKNNMFFSNLALCAEIIF